jgi:glutamine amidotransferase
LSKNLEGNKPAIAEVKSMTGTISIVDYGLGNPESVKNMLKKLGLQGKIVDNPEDLEQSASIIIPGVGYFGKAMELLQSRGWIEVLNQKVIHEKTSVLGICLGMQLFFDRSEEGNMNGLGWIPGEVVRFKMVQDNIKIPHMGWNTVTPVRSSGVFQDEEEPLRYYFVHSYHVQCQNEAHSLATANHGYDFTCAVQKENITGVQFHPEKSHLYGQRFMERYFNLIL